MEKFTEYFNSIVDVSKRIISDYDKELLYEMPYFEKKAKRTILFLFARMDMEGYYKQLLPSFALNEYSQEIRCLMSQVEPFNPAKHISEYHLIVPEVLLNISDYIVIPFTTDNIEVAVRAIKKINKDIKVVYLIDFNYYLLPELYPFYKHYEPSRVKNTIENNIKVVDKVLFSNGKMLDYFYEKLKTKIKGSKTEFFEQPLFLTPKKYLDKIQKYEVEKKKKRILIVCNETHYTDLNAMRDVFIDIIKKFGDRVELVFFGWDGQLNDKSKDALRDVKFTYEKPVPFLPHGDRDYYFQKIAMIDPDFAFIPCKKSEFNETSKNYIKLLEFSSMWIPTFVVNTYPYNTKCEQNQTAIMITEKSEWAFELEMALDEGNSKNIEIQRTAYASVWNKYAIDTKRNITIFEKIFD